MPYVKLEQETIVEALRRLGELAAAEGTAIEICIYGGTAMMLAYNARAATKDVDALVRPRDTGLRLARQVAAEMGLYSEWLNDDVRIFLSNQEHLIPADFKPLIKTNGLTCDAPPRVIYFR
jgi:hypothetical protein